MIKQVAYVLLALGIHVSACANTLTTLDGESRRLSDFVGHGNWVMVNVWSTGCSHCRDELPSLIAFHADNAANAIVLGIAVDYPGFGLADPVALRQFLSENKVNFPVLVADGELAGKFLDDRIDLVPITYAYDPKGRLVARWHGVITIADINEIISDFSQ